jgi:hypothetical protein
MHSNGRSRQACSIRSKSRALQLCALRAAVRSRFTMQRHVLTWSPLAEQPVQYSFCCNVVVCRVLVNPLSYQCCHQCGACFSKQGRATELNRHHHRLNSIGYCSVRNNVELEKNVHEMTSGTRRGRRCHCSRCRIPGGSPVG